MCFFLCVCVMRSREAVEVFKFILTPERIPKGTIYDGIPSRSLTAQPLRNDGWKTTFLLGWYIFRGYVKLPGGDIIEFFYQRNKNLPFLFYSYPLPLPTIWEWPNR